MPPPKKNKGEKKEILKDSPFINAIFKCME